MKLLQWLIAFLVFAFVFCLASLTANGQAIRGDVLGLRPNSLPAKCNVGELRIDSGDSYQLKLCGLSNTWSLASFANPMTTNGDLITQTAGIPARLGIGSTSHVLRVVGGAVDEGLLRVRE